MSTQLEPPKVRWDLSTLFSGPDDPKITASWARLREQADAFAAKYRGQIDSTELTPSLLASALRDIESLSQELSKPLNFASLMFATDAADPKVGAFLQSQRERATELSVKLLFFELELQACPQDVIDRALADPSLSNYIHYVQTARLFSPFRLSEKEEVVLEEMANTGSRAWERFFDETTANHVYKLHLVGEDPKEVSQQEVLNLLRHPDRATRQSAADAFTAGLAEMNRFLVFNYNNLMQESAVEGRLRGLEYPEQSRHLSNELDKETVDLVVALCRQNYGLVERFYNVKREILGLTELTHIDRYAPLFEAEEEISFEDARAVILDAFGGFSTTLRDRAAEFFDKGWIDAEPRPGKQGGAFCSYVTPDTHPYVFMSYLNKMDGVMTLAHELGHGVHASLSRKQTYFNFHGTLPLAELASTFGEMLTFEKLVEKADLKDQLALFADKIEGAFATIFRQAAMFRFEQRCHEARRTSGELSAEQFGDLWQEELQAMFGASVKLEDQHRQWWSYVSHFVSVPFYVYAYSFGELLVFSLYQMAKAEGPSFAGKYVALLELAGSLTPDQLMETVGVDLHSREFWLGGFRALEALVTEFEGLWKQFNA